MRLLLVLGLVALLVSGCETSAPMRTKKSELRPMSAETKQTIAEQSKEASDAAKATSFGEKTAESKK